MTENENIENDKKIEDEKEFEKSWPSVETAEARKALALLKYKLAIERTPSKERKESRRVG